MAVVSTTDILDELLSIEDKKFRINIYRSGASLKANVSVESAADFGAPEPVALITAENFTDLIEQVAFEVNQAVNPPTSQ